MSRRPAALFSALLCSCAGAARPAPSAEEPPLLELPRDVRPLRYALELELVPSRERFRGRAAIEVELSAPRNVLWLHACDLRVAEAAVEVPGAGRLAAALEQVTPEGVARLALPRPIGPGRASLRFSWDAEWNKRVTGLFLSRSGADAYAVSQLEPIDARRVFPSFDEPRFKTPFDVALTVAASDLAVSNEPVLEETPLEDGLKRVRFAATPPLPTYLVFFGAGPFDVVPATLGPNEVRSHPLEMRGLAPRGRGPALEFALAAGAELLPALERWFALPFPYRKLDHVAAADMPWGGMENAGAILYRETVLLFDAGRSEEERRRRIAVVMAHEMAHQWFGDLVTLPWWTDTWLNESFAEFLGARIAHQFRPDLGADLRQLARTDEAMEKDALQSARAVRQPLLRTEDVENQFDRITYDKGAGVLAAFERFMGEEKFRAGLRDYIAGHAHGTGTTEDLLRALSRAAGRDLKGPLLGFVDRPGLPLVSAALECLQGGARVRLSQRRYRPRGSTASEGAPWQIPLCLRFGRGGDTEERCTLLEEAEGSLDLGPGPCPEWILPDAGGVGYHRFALAPAELARLRSAGLPALTAPERLAVATNVRAAQRAGVLPYAEAMETLALLARDPQEEVAATAMEAISFALRHLLAAADRPLAEAYSRRLYRPVLRGLGFEAPADETPERRRFRARAVEFLALEARDPEVRREAARRGLAYAGLADGRFHPEAVDPDLAQVALEVAVQESGAELFDALSARLGTADGVDRERIVRALAAADSPPLSDRAAALWRDGRLSPGERLHLLFLPERRPEVTRKAFAQLRSSLDEVMALLPAGLDTFLPWAAAESCDPGGLEEARSLFEGALPRHPGLRLGASQVLETIEICIAEREADKASALAFFRAMSHRARLFRKGPSGP